jgi:hypothetical protein
MRHVPVLATLPLALLTAGCPPESQQGAVPFSILEACLHVTTPQEQVFRNAEEWRRFYADHTDGAEAPAVDFGRSVVAAHFDGTGSACVGFTVETVEVRGGRVTITATRHTSQDPCIAVVAYPQVLVVVERRDIPVAFQIRDVAGPPPSGRAPCV